MENLVNNDALVQNRINYEKEFDYFKKLYIMQKITRDEYARYLDALYRRNIMDICILGTPLFLMVFLPTLAFSINYMLYSVMICFALMITLIMLAYGIVGITKSGRRVRAVAIWYRDELKFSNGDNPAIFELKRILSEDGYKKYSLWRGILAIVIGMIIPIIMFVLPWLI